MKKVKAVVLGYGDRGSIYADYAKKEPDELEIIGVIDTSELKRTAAKEKFALSDDALYCSVEQFLVAKIKCDLVINATMDELHYSTTMALLKAGYNVLLEKPIVNNKAQLIETYETAKANGCTVLVCHVLRYTLFFSEIKRLIEEGKLGQIVSMQLNEHVGFEHYVNAFVRGKWRKESECGSPLLLQKCCHDMDLICWLNNQTKPSQIASFGTRATYCEENAPEGSTEYCYNCPHREECIYDAEKFEIEKDFIPFYTWAGLNKKLDEITLEEKREFLKRDVYGKCVYKTDMDIVDRQSVSINFSNGSIATLHMVCGSSKAGRWLHIVGTKGEVEGSINSGKFIYRDIDEEAIAYREKEITTQSLMQREEVNSNISGHFGGDYFLMRDLVRYFNGNRTSLAITTLEDSINSHLCCYAAEQSRKTGCIVDMGTYGIK